MTQVLLYPALLLTAYHPMFPDHKILARGNGSLGLTRKQDLKHILIFVWALVGNKSNTTPEQCFLLIVTLKRN